MILLKETVLRFIPGQGSESGSCCFAIEPEEAESCKRRGIHVESENKTLKPAMRMVTHRRLSSWYTIKALAA